MKIFKFNIRKEEKPKAPLSDKRIAEIQDIILWTNESRGEKYKIPNLTNADVHYIKLFYSEQHIYRIDYEYDEKT